MEVKKNEEIIQELKDIDIIPENIKREKKSNISFIHVFESDITPTPKFEFTKKSIRRKRKLEKQKAKALLIGKQEEAKAFWTPEMKLGYCKHSMRKFISLRELQNPYYL